MKQNNALSYYQWNVPTWLLSDCRDRLDATGRGIYRELLDHCYVTGSFPNDPAWICRKCACTQEQLNTVWPVIEHKFVLKNGARINMLAQIFRKEYSTYIKRQQRARQIGISKARGIKQLSDARSTVVSTTAQPISDYTKEDNTKQEETTEEKTLSPLPLPLRKVRQINSDLFEVFWELFVAAGKPLSDRDKERALRRWLNYEEPEHKRILEWTVEQMKTVWRGAEFTPMPFNALVSEGWTRIAAPRIVPDPDDPTVKLMRYAEEQRRLGLR